LGFVNPWKGLFDFAKEFALPCGPLNTNCCRSSSREFGNATGSGDGDVCDRAGAWERIRCRNVAVATRILFGYCLAVKFKTFCKFKMDEIFDTLLLSYDDGLISDEELLFLQEYLCISPNRHSNFPYRDYNPFDWENLDELTCKVEFRFDKQDIPRLQEALQFPEMISIPHATDCPGLEALCILLKRFAYPVRYCDMVPMFGRSVPELCKITLYAINHIYNNHSFRLQSWNQPFLSPENLESYANAIHVKGSPLLTCFGFIDGTVRPICRPSVNQRIVYNGHKRLHAIKFQSICIPNGLIANLSGPWGDLALF
jgi:hypothetical protein